MTDNNVIDFPRIGFILTPPATGNGTPVIEPPTPPTLDTGPVSRADRRSPLDIVNALPDPGILQPTIPTPPQPGHVPATFRNEPASDLIGPRLGALSLAAILATAVAALRGTHTVLSTWWENRLARQAETAQLREARLKHQLAMQNIGDKATQQRAKQQRVPSSSEFGRKSLGGRGSSGGGSGAGKGPGRSGKGTGPSSGTGSSTGPGRKKRSNPAGKNPGSSASTRNSGTTGKGGTGRAPGRKTPKNPGGPLRTNQRGGTGLKKNKPAGSGNQADGSKKTPKPLKSHRKNGRTTLPDALAKDTSKQAARRLKKRRKNLDNPALWTNSKNKASRGKKSPRTTLADAVGSTARKAARKRLKKRRRTITPPIWSVPRNRTTKQQTQTPRKNKPTNAGAATSRTKTRRQRIWDKARAYTRKKAANGGCFGGQTPGPKTGPQAGPNTAGTAGPAGPAGSGPRAGRRSPFENAGQATAPTEWTVKRDDYVGAQAKTWEPNALTTGTPALDAAPTPHIKRPGTTRPKEPNPMPPAPANREDPRITKAKKQAARSGNNIVTSARHMDAQHETEITLDDALDEYGDFAADGFKTHDQCVKLAARATKLRDTLALFTADLATNHNLIGVLFTGAMARMTESMDLVARMAEEMQISSIEAAEQAEAADNDLNDTYRPITQATADAGLTTPSAPIHNQD
ncbi:hypothetical protein ACFYQT_40120 [Streptomyces tibetensis]|uniref:Uncharacterized protein n=1 Tax=Streptomyces tibetensis TaxID=2382123 RepID=A0ABW6N8T9_9ACTN